MTSHSNALEVPDGYGTFFAKLKDRIQHERIRVVSSANVAMVCLYWDVGVAILERQDQKGWGAKVITRLSVDLRNVFPRMRGFSPRNLKYMRAFAETWSEKSFVQEVLAQMSWYHNIALLEKLDSNQIRLWYAKRVLAEGWSRNTLVRNISLSLHERSGQAITNFSRTLQPYDSKVARHLFKDPYLFDFLGDANSHQERDVEQALVSHMQHFLIELGSGFAFVGRQVRMDVGGVTYVIDLLFYHLSLRSYVVVELKTVPFDASFVGTLNMYLLAVDNRLRHTDDKPTIGLLLCKSKNKFVVEYALRGFSKPMGVAVWNTTLSKELPKEYQDNLPSVKAIEAELEGKEFSKR